MRPPIAPIGERAADPLGRLGPMRGRATGIVVAGALALAGCRPSSEVRAASGGGAVTNMTITEEAPPREPAVEPANDESQSRSEDVLEDDLDLRAKGDEGHVEGAPPPPPPPPPPPLSREPMDWVASRDGADDGPTPESATATGVGAKLSADQVSSVIDAGFEKLSACASGETTVSIRATVSTSGRVLEASAVRSTPDDPRVRDCVATTFKTLEFPAVASEFPARLSFDLRLGSAPGGS